MNNELGENEDEIKTIVVTGFGLFRDHTINPSWEAIRDNSLKIDRAHVNIVTEQLDVAYNDVDKVVPNLWAQHKPVLMIHLGLAAHDDKLRLEQFARQGPYIYDDVKSHAPHKDLRVYNETNESLEENQVKHKFKCGPCSFDCDTTCINLDRICEKMEQALIDGKVKIPTRKSLDAGLYLCEYVYHKSLQISDRTLFIHVPSVGEYQIEDIRRAIEQCIEVIIDEVLPSLL